MRYRYGWAWHEHLRQPTREMTEKQARKAWDKGPQVTVAALDGDGDDVVPAYTLTTNAGGEDVEVRLYDADDSVLTSLGYELADGRLFLAQVDEWTYPDDGEVHDLGEATSYRSVLYRTDGSAQVGEGTDAEKRTDLDVSGHWLDPLAWGDWDRVGLHRPAIAVL